MSSIINKYRIYCITENTYRYTWGTTPPTTCPINVAHAVNSNSINETKIRFQKDITFIMSPYYAQYEYLNCDTTSGIIQIKLPDSSKSTYGVLYVVRTVGTNDIELYDGTDVSPFFTVSTSNDIYRITSDGVSWTTTIDIMDDPDNT
jgi:hypothetical protein